MSSSWMRLMLSPCLSNPMNTTNAPKNWPTELLANQTPLVTTRAVLLEIGNALSKLRYRLAAGELLDALERDPQVEIVLITEELYQQALALFCSRLDKEWGLIDCVSYVVMQKRGLTNALTTD